MRSGSASSGAAGAFSGVRIIDFTQDIAGPLAAMLLADLGAEVIKVEPPAGDRGRERPGFWCWSRNKLGVTLDLERPHELELASRLVQSADVALFDRAWGPCEPSQLSETACRERNPALLYATVGGWGAPGPWSVLPADETLLMAMNGAAFSQFSYEDAPVHLVTPQLRYANGILCASAIAAALYERQRSGQGQAISVHAMHASTACLSTSAERAGSSDRSRPIGALGTAPNYKLYRCADGEWLFLATLLPHHFDAALRALGLHAQVLALEGVDGQLRNALLRGVGGRVRALLEACFEQRPRAAWLELLQAHDVPSGPCGTRERWFAGEQVAANQLRVCMQHPQLGALEMPGLPLELSATPARIERLLEPVDPEALLAARSRPQQFEVRSQRSPGGPLQGVRVLDLGTVISTPFAAAILTNFGADVIKLETLGGDAYRGGPGFVGYNRDKRGLALDLKHPASQRLLRPLIERADVVCDNYRVGVLARLGLDYDALCTLNPHVISASVTAFGERGPLSPRPGFDPLLQALSGLMLAQGGDEPVFHQIAVNDVASGLMLSFGIGAALYARQRAGIGQRVCTSLAAQSCVVQSGELTHYAGRPPNPAGRRDCPGLSPVRRFYACADQAWIAIACSSGSHVEALYRALAVPPSALVRSVRTALQADADAELAAWIGAQLRAHSSAVWLARFAAAGVPAALAWRAFDLHHNPLHIATRYFDFIARDGSSQLLATPRSYADFSATPGGFRGAEPRAGEHSREVLRELGCDDAEIDALVAAGHCSEASGKNR